MKLSVLELQTMSQHTLLLPPGMGRAIVDSSICLDEPSFVAQTKPTGTLPIDGERTAMIDF